MAGAHPGARGLVGLAAGTHLALVIAVVIVGMSSEEVRLDPLRPVGVAAIWALPGLWAVISLRGRTWLLLAAAAAALLLAVVPFSVHSFVLAPAGIVYALLFAQVSPGSPRTPVQVLAVVLCPLVLPVALFALVLHEDPVCYHKTGSGEVVVEPGASGSQSGEATIGPDSEIVEQGCTSDTVVWWELAASLGLTVTAGLAGVILLRPSSARGQVHDEAT